MPSTCQRQRSRRYARDHDFKRFALSVIPRGQTNEEEEWCAYARLLLRETARKLALVDKPSIADLFRWTTIAKPDALQAFLSETAAESLFVGADKALASARFVLSAKLTEHLTMPAGDFSLRSWLADPRGGNLFITWREDMAEALKPLVSAWVDVLCTSILSLGEDRERRLWMFLDELASLEKLPSLEDAATKGRKAGLRIVAGLQSTAQLERIYGREEAQTRRSCFRSLVVLGGAKTDPRTCEDLSQSLGEHEVERESFSRTTGLRGDTTSSQLQRTRERVVLLGDTGQTKAIEAGRPFHQLQAAGMETAIMDEIERQKDPALREAVSLAARGDSASSLARLTDIRDVADDHDRRRTIAADYARLPEEERARTIVVAGTNEARREINHAVREDLGLAGRGHEYATLVRRDTTRAERTFSKNYAVGEVIQPERDYPRAGLARGALYEVVENGPGNRLTVRGEQGAVVTFSPMTCRRLSVYEAERSEFAVGDRVRVTRNDAALDLANGDRFTIAAVGAAAVTLTDGRRTIALPADRALHLDHAYATTIHAAQGTTADRVLIELSTRSRTTSQDVYYVALTQPSASGRSGLHQ